MPSLHLGHSGSVSSRMLQFAFSSRAGHGSPPPMAALFRLRLLLLKQVIGQMSVILVWNDIRVCK